MDINASEQEKRVSIGVFCCYAREDEQFLFDLRKHLNPLQRKGHITLWADVDIHAGIEWEKELHRHLNTAQIILLLISPDFMDSEYCYSVEMQRALERHESDDAHVIPIILRPVVWQETLLSKLQALPTDAVPVLNKRWHSKDDAFFDIARGIQTTVEICLDEEERRKAAEAEQARLAKEEIMLRPALHLTDRSEVDIVEVPHMPYIATTTDYNSGKTELNLPQQDKALSFHQQATHSVLKFAPEPQKDATYEEQALQLYQKAFCDIFGFSLNDLADNRQGLLSDKQLLGFMNEHTFFTWIRAWALFLSLLIAVLMTVLASITLLFPHLPWLETILYPDPWIPWMLLLFALVTICFVLYSSKKQDVFVASPSQKRVECIEGKIRTRVELWGGENDTVIHEDHYYDIDSCSFQVPKEACNTLISTINYRLYYLPEVFRIVSIEPLEVPPLISLLRTITSSGEK